MTRDWKRLAAAIRDARTASGITQKELAQRAGVSESTVQNLEAGESRARVPTSLPRVAQALGWTSSSGENILAGGDPALAPPAVEFTAEETQALPLRVRQALGEGHLLDATVIDLPAEGPEGSEAQIVIVVKGKPTASPEAMRQSVEAWEKVERKLRALGTGRDQDDPPTM